MAETMLHFLRTFMLASSSSGSDIEHDDLTEHHLVEFLEALRASCGKRRKGAERSPNEWGKGAWWWPGVGAYYVESWLRG